MTHGRKFMSLCIIIYKMIPRGCQTKINFRSISHSSLPLGGEHSIITHIPTQCAAVLGRTKEPSAT